MKSKAPITLAIILMILGVITGLVKQLKLFTGRPSIPFINQFSGLHSSLIIIGFITILIIYERLIGVGLMSSHKGAYALKNALILTIIGYLIYIYSWSTHFDEASWVAAGILFLGGIAFMRYIDILSNRMNKNSYYLSLVSMAAYLGYIYYMVSGTKNYTAYSLLILSYPTLFIAAERIEITKFVPHIGRKIINFTPLLGGISIAILLIWNNIAFSQGTAAASILIFLMTVMIFRLEYTNIKRLLKIGRWLMKYQAIHLITAYTSLLLGLATYVVFTHIVTRLPVLDTAIHLIALGFIGNMLFAHGPAILTTIKGKSLDEEKIKLYPYIMLNGSLLTRIMANTAKIFNNGLATQLYEVSGLLILLSIPVFILMVWKAAK